MNGMCGIERQVDMHTGLDRPFRAQISWFRKPRALPWAAIGRAVGAEDECAVGLGSYVPKVQSTVAKGSALDTHTQAFKKGLLQQMFV
jgi:hypothetical protein